MSKKTQGKRTRTSSGYSSYDPVITNSAKGLLHHPSRSVAYRNAVNSTVSSVVSAVEANIERSSQITPEKQHTVVHKEEHSTPC